METKNITCLITGASEGIGKAIAEELAKRQVNLILVSRRRNVLHEYATELKKKYAITVGVIALDLAVDGAAEHLYQEISKKGIRVEYLVNNAGFGVFGKHVETNLIREQQMIVLNITTLTTLTKLFARDMVKTGSGKIMNIASTAAFFSGPYMAVYYATKSYVLSYSDAFREELKGTGVTITTVCPGPTHTHFQDAAHMDKSILLYHAGMDVQVVAKLAVEGMIKGKRLVVPGARNKAMTFLARFVPRPLATQLVKRVQELRKAKKPVN